MTGTIHLGMHRNNIHVFCDVHDGTAYLRLCDSDQCATLSIEEYRMPMLIEAIATGMARALMERSEQHQAVAAVGP